MEQVERIAYQSSHEAAARMREIEDAKTKTNSIRLDYEKKVAAMEADFMKNLSEQEARSKLFEQKLKQLDEQAKGERELMRKVQEQSKREQAALRQEMEEKLRRVTQQEAEECRNEYEQKIREKEQLLQDANIQYQESLARLREEKEKANLEAELIKQEAKDAKDEAVNEASARLESTRVRPLNDLFLRVQGLLFSDFSAELAQGHFIRSVGELELGYMLHLGLHESDYSPATTWIENFRNVNPEAESESGLPLFEPYKIFPVYVDPETGDCSYRVGYRASRLHTRATDSIPCMMSGEARSSVRGCVQKEIWQEEKSIDSENPSGRDARVYEGDVFRVPEFPTPSRWLPARDN